MISEVLAHKAPDSVKLPQTCVSLSWWGSLSWDYGPSPSGLRKARPLLTQTEDTLPSLRQATGQPKGRVRLGPANPILGKTGVCPPCWPSKWVDLRLLEVLSMMVPVDASLETDIRGASLAQMGNLVLL